MRKLVISILATAALCGHAIADEQAEEPKHLPTFREALHAANHPNSTDKAIGDPAEEHKGKARTFFEIVRINERVLLDSHNKAKGYSAKVHSAMYSLESGHLRRLFAADMLVKPKPGSPVMKHIQAQNFADEPEGGGKNRFDEWFEEIARKYHLEKFWPRLLVSILLGFTATLVIYLICYAMLMLFSLITGYDPLKTEEEGSGASRRAFKNSSEERLLSQEQERMQESKPLSVPV